MKKLICLIFFFTSLLLASCGEPPVYEMAESVTTIEKTVEISTTIKTTQQTSSFDAIICTTTNFIDTTDVYTQISTTANASDFELCIIGEYKYRNILQFVEFADYSSRHRMSANEPYLPNNPVKNITDWFHDDNITPEQFFTFIIAGYTGKSDPTLIGPDYSYYYVYAKGVNEDHFSDKVYIIRLNGTPSIPCYGVPRVKLGKTYFRYRTALDVGDDLSTYSNDGFLMCGSAFGEVVEIDGIEWLYPNKLFGFEDFANIVEITDDYENQIYKPGEDDDIIEYLKKNNIPIPTYGYKIRLSDFIAEMCN